MKQLTILIPDGHHNLSSVVGTYEVFSKANAHYESMGKTPVFNIQLAGTAKSVKLCSGFFSVHPNVHIDHVVKTNLIIIPALLPDFSATIKHVDKLSEWLSAMHRKGAEIASICTGTFLLATTGLLDDRTCSTHWFAADTFKKMFPNVNLTPDKLITDDRGIYTNGGAFSFLNLLLYLVEKYYDRRTAIYCSKVFQIEMDRSSQSPFVIFSAQKKHEDAIIKKAQVHIEKNLDDHISTAALSSKFAISRRNFDRRFVKATGNTPVEYLRRVKIEAAKKSFETSCKTVNEVMYDVGYSDTKAFREVFKKITGMSPFDYKKRYNKVTSV